MRTIRLFVLLLLITFITACNLTSAIPASPSAQTPTSPNLQTPTSSPTQANVKSSPALTGRADIIFTNGKIITMDEAYPNAEAIAIQGNKILAVGTNEEVVKHRGENTILVSLEGKSLVPGFIDSHQHRIGDRRKRNFNDADPVIQIALEQGWTTINELFVNVDRLSELSTLDKENRLRLRVNAYLAVMDNTPEGTLMAPYYENYSQGQMITPRVRVGGLKVLTDFDNAKILYWEQNDLNAFLLDIYQKGWQLAIKTVSSRSLEMILKSFEYIGSSDPNVINSRSRLEHVLFLTPEQIVRVQHLGLIPSIQTNMPGELVGDTSLTELIAHEPQGSAFPWRSLAKSKIIIANGSAWPSYYADELTGAPFGSPIRLIYQGVTRTGNLGVQPEAWMLDQTITVEEAMRALTIHAAYANFQEDILGSLTAGKLADIVILSENPLQVETKNITNIKVLMTMIDGKVEYCSTGFKSLCPVILKVTSVPSPAVKPTSVLPFTGTWQATDLHDGSIITLSLVQTEKSLTGTYTDTYSPNIKPPGFEGSGSGPVFSLTTSQMKFNLARWDGKAAQVQYSLTLSNQNNTLTLSCDIDCPIVLQRNNVKEE